MREVLSPMVVGPTSRTLGVLASTMPFGPDQKIEGAGETPDTVQVRLYCEPGVTSPDDSISALPGDAGGEGEERGRGERRMSKREWWWGYKVMVDYIIGD